jgi:hypothetical protein
MRACALFGAVAFTLGIGRRLPHQLTSVAELLSPYLKLRISVEPYLQWS